MEENQLEKYIDFVQKIFCRDYMPVVKELLFQNKVGKGEVEKEKLHSWIVEQVRMASYYERGYTEEAAANEIFEKILKNF